MYYHVLLLLELSAPDSHDCFCCYTSPAVQASGALTAAGLVSTRV